MRISDWSSDVCSSDLIDADQRLQFSASRYDAKQNTDYASDPLVAKFSPGSVPARAIRGLQLDEQNRVRNTLLNLDYQHRDIAGSALTAQAYYRDFHTRFEIGRAHGLNSSH